MSKLQEFCYLVVQRDKANKKRKRLLYRLNKKLNEHTGRFYTHIKADIAREERQLYRDHANKMKQITKSSYSPLRRELGIRCFYDGNNSVTSLKYQGEIYYWRNIEDQANTYLFETIILTDQSINNAYHELID
jgi:hypothetical protein